MYITIVNGCMVTFAKEYKDKMSALCTIKIVIGYSGSQG